MSDHEFEKKVQRKMGELKLRPSDAVWTEIEKNIRHNKRRRRFIFWLPVVFLFLATSGYVLYTTNQASAPIAKSTPAEHTTASSTSTNKIDHNENNSTPVAINENDPLPASATAETTQQQERSTLSNQNQKPVTIPGQSSTQDITATDAPATTTARRRTGKVVDNYRNISPTFNNKHKHYKNKQAPVAPDHLAGFNAFGNIDTDNNHTIAEQPTEMSFTMPQTVPQPAGDIATAQAAPNPFTSSSVTSLLPEKQNNPAALPAPPIQKQKGPKWQWGIQVNAGYSRISQSTLLNFKGLLGSLDKNIAEDLAANSTPRSGNVQNSGNFFGTSQTTVKEAAPIQPDLAYSAGVYVQRPLSKRLRLTIGLQYDYMSAHTTIGRLVKGTTNVNYGPTNSTVVDMYYTISGQQTGLNTSGIAAVPRDTIVAQKYTYRFHAFELPVLINWQINKGRRLPPFVLDAGFSVAHLWKIDALHFDGKNGIYYKDNSLFNKTQFNAVMGLNVGLFQDSKLPVWIGPSLRYSLTGLVKKDVSKGQFLWSAGMNVRIGLNRLF